MTLAPFTQARLTNFLTTSEELNFSIDDDGEIGIPFDDLIVWVALHKDLINIRCNIRNFARIEDLPKVKELCNTCNAERTGPKAYWSVVQDDSGSQVVSVIAESTTVMSEWSDEQLKNFFHVSMGQLISYATHMVEELPYLKREDND